MTGGRSSAGKTRDKPEPSMPSQPEPHRARHKAAQARNGHIICEERETWTADPAARLIKDRHQPDWPAAFVPTKLQKEDHPKMTGPLRSFLRKEVIQPQVPLRLPCYDFTPVADPTVVACLLAVSTAPSGKANSHGVTGGVYKARERIHRGMLIRDY